MGPVGQNQRCLYLWSSFLAGGTNQRHTKGEVCYPGLLVLTVVITSIFSHYQYCFPCNDRVFLVHFIYL